MTLENYLRENVALALFILYVPIQKVGNSENEVTKITELLKLFYILCSESIPLYVSLSLISTITCNGMQLQKFIKITQKNSSNAKIINSLRLTLVALRNSLHFKVVTCSCNQFAISDF